MQELPVIITANGLYTSWEQAEGLFLVVLQYACAFVSCGDIDKEEDGLDGRLLQILLLEKLPPEEVQDQLQVKGCVSSHKNHLYYPAAKPQIEELL